VIIFAVALVLLGDLDRGAFFLSELNSIERDGALVEPSSPFGLAIRGEIGHDDVSDAGNSRWHIGVIEDGSIGDYRVNADRGDTYTPIGVCYPGDGIGVGDTLSEFLVRACSRHERGHGRFAEGWVWGRAVSDLDGWDTIDCGVYANVEGGRFPDIMEGNIEVEMDCGGGSAASDEFDRNFYPRSQVAFRQIPAVFGEFGGGVGITLCKRQCVICVFGSLDRDIGGFSGQVKVVQQADDTDEGDPKATRGPLAGLFGLIRSLPFGTKLGLSILFILPAWAIMCRGWDRFDAFDGRLRDRREGLAYCGLASLLLGLSAAFFWQ